MGARQSTATLAALMEMPLKAAEKQAWLSEVYTATGLREYPVAARLSLVRDGSTDTTHLMLSTPGQVLAPPAMTMTAEDVRVWAGMDDTTSVRFSRDLGKESKLSGYEKRGELVVPSGTLPFPVNGGGRGA